MPLITVRSLRLEELLVQEYRPFSAERRRTGRDGGAAGFNGVALPGVVHALTQRRKRRHRIQLTAVLGDLGVVAGAFALGAALWYRNPLDYHARDTLAAVLPAYSLIAVTQHAFSMGVVARARVSALKACGALVVAIGLVGLVAFFLQAVGGVSRGVVGLGTTLAIGGLFLSRTRLALRAHQLLGDVSINEVVIQDGVEAPLRPGSILLDATRDGISLRLDSPEMLDRLGWCLQAADRVIVACPEERRKLWVSALKSANVNAEVLAAELDAIGAIGLGYYEGSTTLAVASAPLSLPDRAIKRTLDLVLVVAATPLLVPLMALVAIAVKLDSPGPVFFRQPRVGLGNRVFHIYKFRSMRLAHSDVAGSQLTTRNDVRVTRVGEFIRRTSLDELPQVLNVLAGDMSIVGPRPHPLAALAAERLYWEVDSRYWHRHAVKPGMTGLAQIRGFRGNTEKETDLTNRLQADLEYVAGWSIWRDLGIIIATFRVLTHRNAF
ncbi:sugar transferase [Sphingomonas bacterium]|uniref:sugar transferase n=1 Tax=Sphingomonas bacterium TaxID=1895847 RepID=UPI0020C6E6D2|nr:sugar transferase [Sphingomonas bacterium]